MKLLSRVRLFVNPWTVAYQAPPSMGFSKQEYCSRLPFPSPGDLPNPGIKLVPLVSLALEGRFFTTGAIWFSLTKAQRVKRLPAMWEAWVRSLGREDPLKKEMAIHSSTLAWKMPWTEEPGRLQSMGSQRIVQDGATSLLAELLAMKLLGIGVTFGNKADKIEMPVNSILLREGKYRLPRHMLLSSKGQAEHSPHQGFQS